MVRLKQVGKQFSGDWIFKNLSLEISKGSRVSLMGPSGSGKSVLLKMIAGVFPPDSGQLDVEATRVAMVFQQSALFDSLSVSENLEFSVRECLGDVTRERRSRILSLLENVGLAKFRDHSPSELSGGMQKRLGIARAVAIEPDLLICDEPTAGLDPVTSKQIAELILDYQKESGCTLISVSNETRRAIQLGEKIAFLGVGELLLTDSSTELAHHKDARIKNFVQGIARAAKQ